MVATKLDQLARFFLQTVLAVAKMERNLIIERTQEGKVLAKQREMTGIRNEHLFVENMNKKQRAKVKEILTVGNHCLLHLS
ncbi:DNA invertase Pin-like site-specific DNA recombinase [Peribacillus simplex]|nr:hypothetical protein UP17_17790 [Peribacillus simplex]MDF9760282.1 DNA invertase Pin-like site-specific DNA recombinase [Peribacillus simplex]